MTPEEDKRFQRLQRANAELRQENARLKAAGNPEKLQKFIDETERAVLFAVKTIEDKTMGLVATQLAPSFKIPPQAMILRAFRDCLRLASHSVNPRTMVALYQTLRNSNPNPDGSVPTYEQIQAILAEDRFPFQADTRPLAPEEQSLFNALTQIWQRSKGPGQYPATQLSEDLKVAIAAAIVLRLSHPGHPAPPLVDELCEAIDNNGGSRPEKTILREALVSFFPSHKDDIDAPAPQA